MPGALPLLALAALAAAALGGKGARGPSGSVPSELDEIQPDALRSTVADACARAGRDKAPALLTIADQLDARGFTRAGGYVRARARQLLGGLVAAVDVTADPQVLAEIDQVLATLGPSRMRDVQPDAPPGEPPKPKPAAPPADDVGSWSDPLAATVAALARRKVGKNDTIAAFQRREGLGADGLYGKRTAAALARYGGPVPPPYVPTIAPKAKAKAPAAGNYDAGGSTSSWDDPSWVGRPTA